MKDLNDPFWLSFQNKSKDYLYLVTTSMFKAVLKGKKNINRNPANPDDIEIPLIKIVSNYISTNFDNIVNNKDTLYSKLYEKYTKDGSDKAHPTSGISDLDWDITNMILAALDGTSASFHFMMLSLGKHNQIQETIYNQLKDSNQNYFIKSNHN